LEELGIEEGKLDDLWCMRGRRGGLAHD
jgi:hypothetical protein